MANSIHNGAGESSKPSPMQPVGTGPRAQLLFHLIGDLIEAREMQLTSGGFAAFAKANTGLVGDLLGNVAQVLAKHGWTEEPSAETLERAMNEWFRSEPSGQQVAKLRVVNAMEGEVRRARGH